MQFCKAAASVRDLIVSTRSPGVSESLRNFSRFMGSATARDINEAKVTVGGVQLHCVTSGTTGSAVLCMPGALGTAKSDFEPQLQGLSSAHRVVSFDPRGYGDSRPPVRDFPLNFYERDADDSASLMAQLMPEPEPYHLIGWSDGAISAVIHAAKNPTRVKSLVIFGGNAFFDESDIIAFENTRDVEASWSQRMKDTHGAIYGADLQLMWSGACDAWKGIYEAGGEVCVDEARRVACPSLVVHGVKDPMCLIEHAYWFNENIPNSRLELFAEGKHNLHLRFPDQFNDLALTFFAETD